MLRTTTEARPDATVMRLAGVLNARTYQQVRDSVIKVAVDTSAAVIIDVNELEVHDEHCWAVFSSARWHVKQWSAVGIALVSGDERVRHLLAHGSVARSVPVYPDVAAATAALSGGALRYRHRAREQFDAGASSVQTALMFVRDHLVAWSMDTKVAIASTVANVFVENVLSHTRGGLDVRLECDAEEIVIAVSDTSAALAVRRERPLGSCPAGLDIVAALCPRWGNTPMSAGKTVWARIGPDDAFAGISRC